MRNEREALQAYHRDRQEKDQLIFQQLDCRRFYEKRMERLQQLHHEKNSRLEKDIAQYTDITGHKKDHATGRKKKNIDPHM